MSNRKRKRCTSYIKVSLTARCAAVTLQIHHHRLNLQHPAPQEECFAVMCLNIYSYVFIASCFSILLNSLSCLHGADVGTKFVCVMSCSHSLHTLPLVYVYLLAPAFNPHVPQGLFFFPSLLSHVHVQHESQRLQINTDQQNQKNRTQLPSLQTVTRPLSRTTNLFFFSFFFFARLTSACLTSRGG